jgi:hypothetical protein
VGDHRDKPTTTAMDNVSQQCAQHREIDSDVPKSDVMSIIRIRVLLMS